MSYPIKYLSLQKAELEYEVAVRGGVCADSVSELRKQIVKLSSTLPSEDILESHLEPADDLKAVKETLLKTHNNIINLKTKFEKNLFARTEILLNHTYHRLNRIDYSASDVSEIYKICFNNFNTQYKDLNSFKSQAVPICQTQAGSTPETVRESNPINVAVSCERRFGAELNKLKYSGKTCVRAFIQRAEELITSKAIPREQMVSFAYDIFTDDALHWFRWVKDRVNSWDDVVTLLKQDFSQSDYDYKLLVEIRARTQGELENITVYIAIMRGMFSRLDKRLPEEDQLEILLHNIRPCYASTLASAAEITDIGSLQKLCRNYENIQTRLKQFSEPPKVSAETLAPEFAYTKQPTNNSSNGNKNYTSHTNKQQNSNLHINEVTTKTEYKRKRDTYCPRCRTSTHSLGSCKKPHFLICFKCGKKDVKAPDCPDCKSKATKN